MHATA